MSVFGGRKQAFSLVEILVTGGVVVALVTMLFPAIGRSIDRAHHAHCVSNLRTLAVGATSFATDRNGYFWTREEVGYSRYRSFEDPLSVCQLLTEYVPNKDVWWCKAGRPTLKKFKNNYAWAISAALDTSSMLVMNPRTTILFWDNYSYTQPSIFNVRDGGVSGPPAASPAYRHLPHINRKECNQVYMDGHVVFQGNNS